MANLSVVMINAYLYILYFANKTNHIIDTFYFLQFIAVEYLHYAQSLKTGHAVPQPGILLDGQPPFFSSSLILTKDAR